MGLYLGHWDGAASCSSGALKVNQGGGGAGGEGWRGCGCQMKADAGFDECRARVPRRTSSGTIMYALKCLLLPFVHPSERFGWCGMPSGAARTAGGKSPVPFVFEC